MGISSEKTLETTFIHFPGLASNPLPIVTETRMIKLYDDIYGIVIYYMIGIDHKLCRGMRKRDRWIERIRVQPVCSFFSTDQWRLSVGANI